MRALGTLGVGILLCACAAPPPRPEQLAALEQRLAAQRARSARIERQLGALGTGAAPANPADGPAPYYEQVVLRSKEPLDSRYEPLLRDQLSAELAKSGARSLAYGGSTDGQQFAPPWEGQPFHGVPVASLFAAAHAATPAYRGAEFDVRVAVEPGPDRVVTVIHELDGRIAVSEAESREPAESADGPAAEVLRGRYRIGPVDGWSAPERASLDQALALLRPAELAVLQDLPFQRRGSDALLSLPGAGARHCGRFEIEHTRRSISIYDCAFGTDENAFVGSLARPLRPSVRKILHEIGHALSLTVVGTVLADVVESHREAQELVDSFNRLGRRVGPDEIERVQRLQNEIQSLQAELGRWNEQLSHAGDLNTAAVRSFLELENASSGFTPYGRTSPVEGFAEAFSLCRTDPDAGRRISREVCDFFASDAYLKPVR
jgi:hypothetical protein